MAAYHFLLNLVDPEDLYRILAGLPRMGIAMHLKDVHAQSGIMPVVEIEIVQKCSHKKISLVTADMKTLIQQVGGSGYVQAVFQYTDLAMGTVVLHLLNIRVCQVILKNAVELLLLFLIQSHVYIIPIISVILDV